jgi:hypothetical protein
LREELELGVFKNKVMRKLFVPTREEVTRQWGGVNNEELYDCTSHQTLFG